jgi:hypothetical protein
MGAFADLIAFLALVGPGLLFEVGLARSLNYLRRPLSDRVLRFGAWSLLWHACLLPATVVLVLGLPGDPDLTELGGAWFWFLAVTLVPWLMGLLIGRYATSEGRLRDLVLGKDPAPLAWHQLFESAQDGEAWIRVRFRDGGWIAGKWAFSSDEPEDLLLAPRVQCDPMNGSIQLDSEGKVQLIDWQALIRVADLDRLELQAIPTGDEDAD